MQLDESHRLDDAAGAAGDRPGAALRARRAVLTALACAPFAAGAVAPAIVQPRQATPAAFAERALAMRQKAIERGDQPYGAVIVRDGRIVGEGSSAVVVNTDPTAHAEIQAIRDAAARLRSVELAGCVMYGSSRACPMCEAAAYWAGIARLYHGAEAHDDGPPRLR